MSSGVYKRKPRSEEHCRNISRAKIGKSSYIRTEETRQKTRVALTGKKQSSESNEKRRIASTGKKLGPASPERCEKIRIAQTGKKQSPETIEKRRAAATTPEALEKSRSYRGDKSSGWKGGISDNPYSPEFNDTRKQRIRERDGHVCQRCSRTREEEGQELNVHHIDYDKQNYNDNNLITLCRRCNTKVNANRDYHQQFFQQILELQSAILV